MKIKCWVFRKINKLNLMLIVPTLSMWSSFWNVTEYDLNSANTCHCDMKHMSLQSLKSPFLNDVNHIKNNNSLFK